MYWVREVCRYTVVCLIHDRSSGERVDSCSQETLSSFSPFYSSSISLGTTIRLSTARGRTEMSSHSSDWPVTSVSQWPVTDDHRGSFKLLCHLTANSLCTSVEVYIVTQHITVIVWRDDYVISVTTASDFLWQCKHVEWGAHKCIECNGQLET